MFADIRFPIGYRELEDRAKLGPDCMQCDGIRWMPVTSIRADVVYRKNVDPRTIILGEEGSDIHKNQVTRGRVPDVSDSSAP